MTTATRYTLGRIAIVGALALGLGAAPAFAAPQHSRPAVATGVAGAVVGAATTPLWMMDGAFDSAPDARGQFVAPVINTPRGPYYAYSRYSGQVYSSCVIDEGYGRTRSCDAGR